MPLLNPYLNLPGNTEEAFNFYRSVFGGEFTGIHRFKDTPESGRVAPADADKIMHIGLRVGNNVLMGTDALESMGHTVTNGTNISLSVNVESEAEADRVFAGLSAGGKVSVPMAKMFWGDYFGMLTDKFGIQWMVAYSYGQTLPT